MANIAALPPNMKALVVHSRDEEPRIETVETPQPTIGSATVRVLSANVISYMKNIYNGTRPYTFPTPLIPGCSALGRIVATGPDATLLQSGDLVFIDGTTRSRDNPIGDIYLASIHDGWSPGSKKLMADVYRDWTFAEYARIPLENLTKLNESILCGSLGYTIPQLSAIAGLLVPFGGLNDISLRPGQTVIIAPATGPFGGYAVLVALAMGAARVIAMGRNTTSLTRLKSLVPHPSRVETVPMTGDVKADTLALCAAANKTPIDAYFDIGPPEAAQSTHIKSCILALRAGAKICFMGGYKEDVPIPHHTIMHWNMRIQGKWMYERGDIAELVKLLESGMLPLGEKGGFDVVGDYPLEQWKEAWDVASEKDKFGQVVVISP